MIKLRYAAIALLFATPAMAAEPIDKDLEVMLLQRVVAEQTLRNLQRDTMVAEYERIKGNYEKLMAQIAEHETKKKKEAEEKNK